MKKLLIAFVLAGCLVSAGLASASAGFQTFQTPSKNIHCAWSAALDGVPASLRCDIDSGLKPRPPRPANCDFDFGDSIEVGRTGKAHLVCHGDTTKDPKAKVLAYGATWRHGGITCKSRTDGLRCVNTSGHGFFLSRQSWRRF